MAGSSPLQQAEVMGGHLTPERQPWAGNRGPVQHLGPGAAFTPPLLLVPTAAVHSKSKNACMRSLTTTFQGMEFIKILLGALG